MLDRKPRIGFVGVGSMGQCAHLKNYSTLDSCEVVALAELREDLGQAVGTRYGVPKVYASAEAMLAAEELDGIVASQPFDRHGRLVPDLLEAGVPLFTEKPLAASVEVGETVATAVAASGTWHMVGYHKRSDPATMAAKAEIDRLKQTGDLGKMTYVRILMPAGDWVAAGFTDLIRVPGDYPVVERDPPASDMDTATFQRYTAFVNYYIHQVNLMRHLLGEDYAITYADPSGVLLVGQSESEIACTIEMSPYQTSVDWQESAFVCFERGTVTVELPAPLATRRPGRVTFFRDPGDGATPETRIPQLPWIHAMRQQAMNFVAAVKGERPPICEAAEALKDLRLARDYIRLLTGC